MSNLAQDENEGLPFVGPLLSWLTENVIPLLLLVTAIGLLWLGAGKGDNAGVMKRVIALVIVLGIVGLALTNFAGVDISKWLLNLFGAGI
ncbi:hypothetical protein [Amycolatopsis keratiniphila]|uniref:TrbC/VIRB2 family protein n=1 Tax=Amycolatopsis keratiniphila subsp. keratiniphila TaxID=227715 RepID=A0A1W2M266_9PSEU|nr:hypothetical protein [Amycolatopsis keratiniphila]ONF73951.1 hypothetical protein AVR91_0204270 [Amycolatopsis keratiniphila subsp. keratiniphila]